MANFADNLPKEVRSFDITTYKNPTQLNDGAVLVVGSGQTGVQIAEQLLQSDKRVYMATSKINGFPRNHRGTDVISAVKTLGMFNLTREQATDEQIYAKPPMIGVDKAISYHHLDRNGATLLGRLENIEGGVCSFNDDLMENIEISDGSYNFFFDLFSQLSGGHERFQGAPEAERDAEFEPSPGLLEKAKTPIKRLNLAETNITNVIWATGLGASFPWLNMNEATASFGKNGMPSSTAVDALPGFYWVGFNFQRTFASNFLFGFGEDSQHAVDSIVAETAPIPAAALDD